MFEIVCEVANISGKTLTIETSIPEAEKPDVRILKSGQQLGVFASPTRSTVKITVVSVEDANRIEKLEAALRVYAEEDHWSGDTFEPIRFPEGECKCCYEHFSDQGEIARKALEGKDD
jgi:hypothetical protein